jgi:hypothetical protein
MSVMTRRELMKQGLKATTYVAPAVLTVASAPRAAAVSCGGPPPGGCKATLKLVPPTSSNIQFPDVRWIGTGYTPNGKVLIHQPTNFHAFCRAILVVIPGTSITADASGNFDLLMPTTAFGLSLATGDPTALSLTQPPPVEAEAIDDCTGCSSGVISFPILLPGPDPSDSFTLRYVPSPVSTALAPFNVPSETGSGTVIVGQCHVSNQTATEAKLAELRMTLSGATPNRTFTLFMTIPGFAPFQEGTVTTDGAGNATLARYFPKCMPNIVASSTLSLTIDGNPPGASNVAYRTTVVKNDNMFCG